MATSTIDISLETASQLRKMFSIAIKNDLTIKNNYSSRIEFSIGLASKLINAISDEDFKRITGLEK